MQNEAKRLGLIWVTCTPTANRPSPQLKRRTDMNPAPGLITVFVKATPQKYA